MKLYTCDGPGCDKTTGFIERPWLLLIMGVDVGSEEVPFCSIAHLREWLDLYEQL